MVVNLPPNLFNTGITRIDRRPGETQEQFDSTKDTAIFPADGQKHVLTLDGKIDDVIVSGLRPGYTETLITDIRSLASKTDDIKRACENADTLGDTSWVDLGTGQPWAAFPNRSLETRQITSYDLISGPGPQELNVRFADGGLDISVHSKDTARELNHSMRATFAADGSVTPTTEGVSYFVPPASAETASIAAPAAASGLALSPEDTATAATVASALAAKLEVAGDAVTLSGFSAREGFNASNFGFAVSGELQISAWTEGLELKFEHDGASYTYRGLDASSGRFGQQSDHVGYWKQDERGIFIPDLSASSGDAW